MRHPLGKLCAFQAASALVSDNDGALELAMGTVKLSLVCNDALVKGPESHNICLEPPIIHSLDCIKEGSVARGWPLKGLMDPMG